MKTTIRYCEDIGMYAYDRQISASCVHATAFCKKECFNDKLYKLYPAMHGKDIRNEAYWAGINGTAVAIDLKRRAKHKQTSRMRLMTRGESFSTIADVDRVESILTGNPGTDFWIPTRAWQNPILRAMIETRIRVLPNARIVASMDVTNTMEQWESLAVTNWSTMSFGCNEATVTPLGDRMFKCPKTFQHINGHCSICKAGCFKADQADRPVHVLLKQH